MIYQPGDYVYPADLPRAYLCRVRRTESLDERGGRAQMLRLQPLDGPWPAGTELVRLDDAVVPAGPRQLWQRPTSRRPRHPAAA